MDVNSLASQSIIVSFVFAVTFYFGEMLFSNKSEGIWYPFVFVVLSVVRFLKWIVSCFRRMFV